MASAQEPPKEPQPLTGFIPKWLRPEYEIEIPSPPTVKTLGFIPKWLRDEYEDLPEPMIGPQPPKKRKRKKKS